MAMKLARSDEFKNYQLQVAISLIYILAVPIDNARVSCFVVGYKKCPRIVSRIARSRI